MSKDRPSREWLHMANAIMWSDRSLCLRQACGAIITTPDMRSVVGIGYNGPAADLPHNRCRGTPGSCGCLHAEDNAIARKRTSDLRGLYIFVTHYPCEMCAQRCIQAGISKIYWLHQYREMEPSQEVLNIAGIETCQMDLSSFEGVGSRWILKQLG